MKIASRCLLSLKLSSMSKHSDKHLKMKINGIKTRKGQKCLTNAKFVFTWIINTTMASTRVSDTFVQHFSLLIIRNYHEIALLHDLVNQISFIQTWKCMP